MQPDVTAFFDEATNTVTYVVAEPGGPHCVIIDPVRDYDPKSGRTRLDSADLVLGFVQENNLKVDWILETHAHADHLTAAPYLKERLGASVGIGSHIRDVQATFRDIFNVEPGFSTDGSQFDRLFEEGDEFKVGSMTGKIIHTPGHTPACVTYLFGATAFVGDTLFMPDYGTARCDFPGGDAATLYRSIRKILSRPPDTRLFMCHDYKAPERDDYAWETTVADERAQNVHIHDGVSEAEFVALRTMRDKTLDMPVLVLPAVQVNMRAGQLPPPEDNGISYLKIPVDAL
jgi:glyoxylase-like metal-dependent hydrolase (beta-lactamase superfamily II)